MKPRFARFMLKIFCTLSLVLSLSFLVADKSFSNTLDRKKFIEEICFRIQTVAKAQGIPEAFLARLIWKESRFDPNAVSPVGAQGIAQFMPGTAKLRGLGQAVFHNGALAYLACLLKHKILLPPLQGMPQKSGRSQTLKSLFFLSVKQKTF